MTMLNGQASAQVKTMGWTKRKIVPTPRHTPAKSGGCPTCGDWQRRGRTTHKGGRVYIKGHRVYWPLMPGYRGGEMRRCDDPYHDPQNYYSWPGKLDVTEQEYVASLPHVGPPPLSDEARERAAANRRRNRARQGKSKR